MSKFIIEGGRELNGEIEVRGAKNAATPIIAAALLSRFPSTISNLPLIEDVFRMLEILESVGAKIEWTGKREVTIKAARLDLKDLDQKAVSFLRSSILLLGPLFGQFEKFDLSEPGGCLIGSRPLDAHFEVIESFGGRASKEKDFLKIERGTVLNSVELVMNEASVTATENALMIAAGRPGQTTIYNAASEPSVQDLCCFLMKMGVKIKGFGTRTLEITGEKELKGVRHHLIPDPIEMGTFIVLGAVAGGEIIVKKVVPEFLRSELKVFKQMGVDFEIINVSSDQNSWGYEISDVKVKKSDLRAIPKIHNAPHPGFAADLIQPVSLLATQAQGKTLIHDWMFDGRQRYAGELQKMGAVIETLDPHRILISGPSRLRGSAIQVFDLRGGITLLLAGLVAAGKTVINDAYQADRGYEKIEERLRELGAEIRRE